MNIHYQIKQTSTTVKQLITKYDITRLTIILHNAVKYAKLQGLTNFLIIIKILNELNNLFNCLV